MTEIYTPVARALVAAVLLLASLTVTLVTVSRAPAADALVIGACGTFGEASDFQSVAEAPQEYAGEISEPGLLGDGDRPTRLRDLGGRFHQSLRRS